MANWYPSRRILGSPGWLWFVLAVPLFLVANLPIPKQDFIDPDLDHRPSELAEPPDRGAIGKEQIIVAREGDSFRFVSVAQRDAGRTAVREKRNIEPLWAVFVERGNYEGSFSCGASDFFPGLIHQEARWTYALRGTRTDYGWWMELSKNGIDWKGDKESPYELPAEQIRQLRPLVVAELNRHNPTAILGDRLEKMLDDGLEVSFTFFAPQNALILLRWLGLLMAVVGICSMFLRPRAVPVPRVALPMSETEVLLIKIAAVRERLKKRYKAAC
jgi:hypothetical protein